MRCQIELTNQIFHDREIPQMKKSVNPPGFERRLDTVLNGR
jgi:hypothetical protein